MHAVFLRAANVGGRNVFSPKAFCAEHPELALTNFGAAGTFRTSLDGPTADVERTVREALPIDADMAVVPGADVMALVASEPFSGAPADAKPEVTVLLGGRRGDLAWPEDERGITLHADWGWCLLTCRDPGARGRSPYEIAQRAAGVSATTRSWNMVQKVAMGLRTSDGSDATP